MRPSNRYSVSTLLGIRFSIISLTIPRVSSIVALISAPLLCATWYTVLAPMLNSRPIYHLVSCESLGRFVDTFYKSPSFFFDHPRVYQSSDYIVMFSFHCVALPHSLHIHMSPRREKAGGFTVIVCDVCRLGYAILLSMKYNGLDRSDSLTLTCTLGDATRLSTKDNGPNCRNSLTPPCTLRHRHPLLPLSHKHYGGMGWSLLSSSSSTSPSSKYFSWPPSRAPPSTPKMRSCIEH